MKIVAQTSFFWGTIRLKKVCHQNNRCHTFYCHGTCLELVDGLAVSEVERFPQNISAYG
jgi:hypothetical protein